jgi:hypothetical protein
LTETSAPSDIAGRRLAAQRLTGKAFTTPVEAVRFLGAVQAQDYPGASWGVGQRVGCTEAAVNEAVARGEILRTHVLRPTWHLVAAGDIRWLLALTAPRIIAASAGRYRRLGLDDVLLARTNTVIASALAEGSHLTRGELGAALVAVGIDATAREGLLAHIVMRAELDAVVCSGVPRGNHQTYALLEERAPRPRELSGDEALAELTQRYFTSHGPALVEDFAWWAGLTLATARRGTELAGNDLAVETAGGTRYWSSSQAPRSSPEHPIVRLLPNFDEYIVAYRGGTQAFHSVAARATGFVPRNLAANLVVVDGRVVGRWRRHVATNVVTIELSLFEKIGARVHEALADELDRYSAYVGSAVTTMLSR